MRRTKCARARFYRIDWCAANRNGTIEHDQRAWLADELRKLPKPLGVMGINDELTAVVLYSAAAAKLSVPEQVAVVGVDDDPFAGELAPMGLSSVDSDPVRQGYRQANCSTIRVLIGRTHEQDVFAYSWSSAGKIQEIKGICEIGVLPCRL